MDELHASASGTTEATSLALHQPPETALVPIFADSTLWRGLIFIACLEKLIAYQSIGPTGQSWLRLMLKIGFNLGGIHALAASSPVALQFYVSFLTGVAVGGLLRHSSQRVIAGYHYLTCLDLWRGAMAMLWLQQTPFWLTLWGPLVAQAGTTATEVGEASLWPRLADSCATGLAFFLPFVMNSHQRAVWQRQTVYTGAELL